MVSPGIAGNRVDRFELVRCLGRGGMGVVYEALDPLRQTRVALKTLAQIDAGRIHRLKQEFRSLAGIVHPNLVTLHELFARRGEWFFTMELVDGVDFLRWVRTEDESEQEDESATQAETEDGESETLALLPKGAQATLTALHRRPLLPDEPSFPGVTRYERLRPALAQLAEGVRAIHRAGHMHRDLKPSNVRVTPSGQVKVLDFGLVAAFRNDKTSDEIVGTSGYMAPEQAAGRALTPAVDWYAFGVMLFEALCGRRPFVGSRVQVLIEKQTLDAPSVLQFAPQAAPDLARLCADLLAREPSQRPQDEAILRRLGVNVPTPSLITSPDPPFVGRTKEIALLDRAIAEASGGNTVAVLLHGTSGIGKTALIRRFVDDAAKNGACVLSGRCYERESLPFKGLDAAIDSLTVHLMSLPRHEQHALLPPDVQALANLFPVLSRVPGVRESRHDSPSPLDARERLRAASSALAALLHGLATRQPLVLWLDDLQWSDADGAELLSHVLGSRPPLLFIGSMRSEEVATSPVVERLTQRALLGRWRLQKVAVGPLSKEDAESLARVLAGDNVMGHADRAKRIALESAGIPFFVHELARHSAQKHEAFTVHDPEPSGEDTDDPTRELIRLDHALAQRISRLEPQEKRILDLIAVAGHPIDENVCTEAANVAAGDAQLAIAKLRAAHLVQSRITSGRAGLEPYHDRVGRVVVRTLDSGAIAELHRRIAQALENVAAEPELLTLHYRRAGDDTRAAIHALRAAERAREALAFDRAADLYRLALDLAPTGEVLKKQTLLAESLSQAGRVLEAAQAYLQAARKAPAQAALGLRAKAAELFLVGGYLDRGLVEMDGLLQTSGIHLPKSQSGELTFLIANRIKQQLFGLKLSKVENPDQRELEKIDLCWSGTTGLGAVDMLRAAVFNTEALKRAARAGDPMRFGRSLGFEAVMLAILGGKQLDRAQKALDECSRILTALNSPYLDGLLSAARGYCAMSRGRWSEMLLHGERAERVLSRSVTGARWELNMSRTLLLWALSGLGRMEDLRSHLEPLIREADRCGDRYAATFLRGSHQTNIGWLAADEVDLTERQVEEATSLWSNERFHLQHWWQMASNAQIALYRGEGRGAWASLNRRWPALLKSGMLRVQNVRIGALQFRGRCALAAAQETGDEKLIAVADRAAQRLAQIDAGWSRAHAKQIRARCLQLRGDLTGAKQTAREAAAAFEAEQMKIEEGASRRLLGQLTGEDAVVVAAEEMLAACGVRRPGRFAEMLNGQL